MNDIGIARFLRWTVVSTYLNSGDITREDAVELLSGPLNPDDPSTVVDDTDKLGMSPVQVEKILEQECRGTLGPVVFNSGGVNEKEEHPRDDL